MDNQFSSQATDDIIVETAAPPGPPWHRRLAQDARAHVSRLDVLCYAVLAIILAAGAWLRLDGQNWDDFTHLHPDERFLTQVVEALNGPLRFTDSDPVVADQLGPYGEYIGPGERRVLCEQRYPQQTESDGESVRVTRQAGAGGYFDAECSPLNPNNVGQGLYVYGEFPLFTVHLMGTLRTDLSRDVEAFLGAFDAEAAEKHTVTSVWETYTGVQLVGRAVSAVADWLTIVVVFLLGRRLYSRWTGLLAAGFYAFAPFPIQQAHFWTVDAFTTFWVALALYFAVRALDGANAWRGTPVWAYLGVWAGGMLWNTADREQSVLGLVSLGVIFLVVVALASLARLVLSWRGKPWGELLVAGAPLIAALVYFVGWGVISLIAPNGLSISGDVMAVRSASLVFALLLFVTFAAARVIRGQTIRLESTARYTVIIGAFGLMWMALIVGVLVGVLSTWATLFVALSLVALLLFDLTDLSDYFLFGAALGGALAGRVNMAPLAGIIVVAAIIRTLPVLDTSLSRHQRNRLVANAMTGVMVAALTSLIVFRLLQPHAFLGPNFISLQLNPGWREDVSEAARLTSGDWDGPPNHQWANRPAYVFPWRNIVLWGMGIPLGLVAWAAWAWAGWRMIRARAQWTRHLLLFLWILVYFGWLGGRWVTTMRYFLPLYPALAVFAAWALWGLVTHSWDAWRGLDRMSRRTWRQRLAFGSAAALLVFVALYTALFGIGFNTIHQRQLTRVAASRWFQEFVPGDLGIWVEGTDGTRQMVNIGRSYVAPPPQMARLEQGESEAIAFTVPGDARLDRISFNMVGDPDRDDEIEQVAVRVYRTETGLDRALVYEDRLTADFNAPASPFGAAYTLVPEDDVELAAPLGSVAAPLSFELEVQAEAGGPVFFLRDVTSDGLTVLSQVTLDLALLPDGMPSLLDLNFDSQPLLTGHGDDIPITPTHWTTGGSDPITFTVPINGEIREIEIPHLGDALQDADAETVTLTLIGPTGEQVSTTITDDFQAGADPLGPPRTVVFDPPLAVTTGSDPNVRPIYTLTVAAEDPIYTSGPVIAWEGDWDDPIPTSVCPLPDDVVYRDDLPSGMSSFTCAGAGLYGAHYQGIKLWMVAEDNDQKFQAMTNALDQADYIIMTSNRFYDSLTRVPMRWPMTGAYYDALWDGRLGFEVEKVWTSYPQLGPITIPDEILPTDDLPDWLDDWRDVLNDQWEAEEAFHVYDHPAVLLFRKTDAYSPENTRTILNSVSRRHVSTANLGYLIDPEPVGVLPWGAKQATESPTLLEFTEQKWAIQQDGGTWADLFDTGDLINRNHVAAVIVWWLLIVAVGWLTWPLLFCIFPALPDRAFPAAKITGWLIVAWVAWTAGTANIRSWSRGGILLILLALALLSLALGWRRRAELWAYVRAHWRHLLWMEGLTLLLFLGFLGVRLGNPDLWHGSFGGEKPMDFAYFNAVLRSTVFPPLDPWFAQGYLNYYYFGYVIVGAPVKLLGLNPSIAYNVILPTLYAMTGIGVFSLAYNWVRSREVTPPFTAALARQLNGQGVAMYGPAEESESGENPSPDRREPRSPAGNAWLAGLLAMLLAVVLGNLGTLHVILTEVAKLDGWQQQPSLTAVLRAELDDRRFEIRNEFYQDELETFRTKYDREPTESTEIYEINRAVDERTDAYINDAARHPPLFDIWEYGFNNFRDLVGSFFDGLDEVMDGAPLQMHTHRWHWAPTRIISELPRVDERYPQPGFNAIAEMPYFTFLYGDLHAHMIAMPVTLLVLTWLLAEIIGAGRQQRTRLEALLALALGAMTVGVLRPTNSWDWITYLILGVAGLTYVAWLGATRASMAYAPSRLAERTWGLIRPHRVWRLWPVLGVVPLAVILRIAYYLFERIRADEQANRGLRLGETPLDPTLTISSMIVWAVAALALVVVFYMAFLIAVRAYLDRRVLVTWLGRVALFVALTYVAALPFTMYFATQYNEVKPWEHERTPIWAYMYVHGTFIFIVASFLVWQTARWLRGVRVRQLQGMVVPALGVVLGMTGVLAVSLYVGVREVPIAQFVVPMIVWAVLLFLAPRQSPLVRAVNAIIVLALAITVGVEVVVLDGDIGRQNTVFKFYIQVWLLLSVTGGVMLAWMLRSAVRWSVPLRSVWQAGLAILFTIALLYPVLATQARFLDRFNRDDTPLTLDGMEYMKYAVHGENGVWFRLRSDYDLIRWMQEHIDGTPVVMEAHLFPPLYHWSARVSIYTGLPTVLGWDWHQQQQRTLPNMNALIHTRQNNIAAFYTLPGAQGIETAMNLIHTYDVEYIVLGVTERVGYNDIQTDEATGLYTTGHAEGLAKFDEMVALDLLEVVYEADYCLSTTIDSVEECPPESVYTDKIYRVVPGAEYSSDVLAAQP